MSETEKRAPTNAAVLIMDVVQSVSIANVLGPRAYDEAFITPLHRCFRSLLSSIQVLPQDPRDPVLDMKGFPKYELQRDFFVDWHGDEFVAVFCGGDPLVDVPSALWLGSEALVRWYLRGPNPDRIADGLEPFHLSAGVHYGPVTLGERASPIGQDRLGPEGIALGIAKRIQLEARRGKWSRIYATDTVVEVASRADTEALGEWRFSEPEWQDVRGWGSMGVHELRWGRPRGFAVTGARIETLLRLFERWLCLPYLAGWVCQHLLDMKRPDEAQALATRIERQSGIKCCIMYDRVVM